MIQHLQQWLAIYVKGIAMGAADVVPGVSGGTIAFVTGIYERLLNAIKSVNPHAITVLRRGGVKALWQHIDAGFLLCLMAGIATSIFSLAKIISYLLQHHPILVWSFFFGLIIASALHMLRTVQQWHLGAFLAILLGTIIAYGITEVKPADFEISRWMVFAAGSIAICAMILPGISGSFILLLMGMYQPVLAAIKAFDVSVIALFAAGAGVGLLSFAHVLSWLLNRFHTLTLCFLTGFLFGSLNLVWPWKVTLEFYQSRHGLKPLVQENVWPLAYEQATQLPAYWPWALLMIALGFAAVLVLELVGNRTVRVQD